VIDLPGELRPDTAGQLALALGGDENEVALRAGGRHGRRLVRAPLGERTPVRRWRPEGTVLITGGTGALGAHTARYLAAQGAGHLLLLSRRGETAPGADVLAAELTALGAEVTFARCDVADREALAAVLAGIPGEHPLTAVVHTAAVLDDTVLDSLTPDRMERVLAVKAGGALALHELTADLELSAFVLYSSFAGTVGIAGQGNYAPGNAFLDALARYRRSLGLPGTSLAWGHWDGGGIAEPGVERELRRRGASVIDPALAVTALGQCLDHDETYLAVGEVDWAELTRAAGAGAPPALLREIPELRAPKETDAAAAEPDLPARLGAMPAHLRQDAVLELVRTQVAAVLGHTGADAVASDRAFTDLGFDSLTAVELRNRLTAATGLKLPATLVFSHPCADALAEHLLDLLAPDIGEDVTLLAELDRLEAGLAALPPDDPGTARIATRLRALTRRLEEGAAPAEEVDIDAASHEELFALIDEAIEDR
jgi:NADP-dependent 3-hydroxy acid dehydrogenase YdfG/acyl carrier protein